MATNRPNLPLTRAGSMVNLSWPLSTDSAYVLQSSTNLSNSTSWIGITNIPVVSLNQNIVTLAITNHPNYFRLKK